MELVKHTFQSIDFYFNSTPTLPFLLPEIFGDNYHVLRDKLEFSAGDVVIDLGANEGIFSILLAKLFPQVQVLAFEPVPRTFKILLSNISLNHCANIKPINLGSAGIHTSATMILSKEQSGGSSTLIRFNPIDHVQEDVILDSFDNILANYLPLVHATRVKLLKIDIEGGEYETLFLCTKLNLIDNVVGEFHMNNEIMRKKYMIPTLIEYLRSKTNLLHFETCRMAD
jgi:FkbM family methyltransferase